MEKNKKVGERIREVHLTFPLAQTCPLEVLSGTHRFRNERPGGGERVTDRERLQDAQDTIT
ncbi:MAG: hypothetical protein SGJ02_10030 [bacterium]|nr:hypothetical protein [bacterium]